jgi:hypothetical protein
MAGGGGSDFYSPLNFNRFPLNHHPHHFAPAANPSSGNAPQFSTPNIFNYVVAPSHVGQGVVSSNGLQFLRRPSSFFHSSPPASTTSIVMTAQQQYFSAQPSVATAFYTPYQSVYYEAVVPLLTHVYENTMELKGSKCSSKSSGTGSMTYSPNAAYFEIEVCVEQKTQFWFMGQTYFAEIKNFVEFKVQRRQQQRETVIVTSNFGILHLRRLYILNNLFVNDPAEILFRTMS